MSEIDTWKEAFALFDKDGDGNISSEELGTVMRALGQSPTQAEVAEIVKEAGSESIDFETFKNLMQKHKRNVDPEKELREAFKVFDKEGKGYVSTNEMRTVLTSMGEKLSEEEVDGILQSIDKDGKISLEEFIEVLLKPTKSTK
jgi:calmodulin